MPGWSRGVRHSTGEGGGGHGFCGRSHYAAASSASTACRVGIDGIAPGTCSGGGGASAGPAGLQPGGTATLRLQHAGVTEAAPPAPRRPVPTWMHSAAAAEAKRIASRYGRPSSTATAKAAVKQSPAGGDSGVRGRGGRSVGGPGAAGHAGAQGRREAGGRRAGATAAARTRPRGVHYTLHPPRLLPPRAAVGVCGAGAASLGRRRTPALPPAAASLIPKRRTHHLAHPASAAPHTPPPLAHLRAGCRARRASPAHGPRPAPAAPAPPPPPARPSLWACLEGGGRREQGVGGGAGQVSGRRGARAPRVKGSVPGRLRGRTRAQRPARSAYGSQAPPTRQPLQLGFVWRHDS